jgi:hypothetical protein
MRGHCVGGDADLALHCDLMIVASDASIGYPPVRNLGVSPNLWLHRLGPQLAERVMLTGDLLTGEEAFRLGLARESCPADQLDAVAIREAYSKVSFKEVQPHGGLVGRHICAEWPPVVGVENASGFEMGDRALDRRTQLVYLCSEFLLPIKAIYRLAAS